MAARQARTQSFTGLVEDVHATLQEERGKDFSRVDFCFELPAARENWKENVDVLIDAGLLPHWELLSDPFTIYSDDPKR